MKIFGDSVVRIIGAAITVLVFLFGLVQYFHTQQIEASKPFLQRKLQWCEEATETAAAIARGKAQSGKEERFWQMYWGVMGMVENRSVGAAMVAFGDALKSGTTNQDVLSSLSLRIAHACRGEMADDWSSIWKRL